MERSWQAYLVQCVVVFGCFVGLASMLHCSKVDNLEGKECKFDNQCKGKDERCVYSDPSCAARIGSCVGVCKAPSQPPDVACACKVDEDCNYPFEGCGNCQCYKRDVLACETDADCGRGRLCVGQPSKRVCEVRTGCQKDTDCLEGYVCREQSCCNAVSGRCPGKCQVGSPCQDNVDCLVCNLSCKEGVCAETGPSCSGVKCEKDQDCATCGGKCQAGYCLVQNNTPTCEGKTCATDTDCFACSGSCSNGVCRVGGTSCSTGSCFSDADCQSRGLNSCLAGCCQ